MEYYAVNTSSALYHHGILGQRWGVRRYQNSDGSLTDAGRKRYLGSDGNLNSKGKKKLDSQKYENYKVRINEEKRKEEIRKEEEKQQVKQQSKEFMNKMNRVLNDDDFIDGNYQKFKNDPRFREKWEKNAELGLLALKKSDKNNDYGDEKDPYEQDWFLFEDQTLGMPVAANLIRKGYSSDDVKEIYKKASQAYSVLDYGELDDGFPTKSSKLAREAANSGIDYGYSRITDFIDACEQVREERKNDLIKAHKSGDKELMKRAEIQYKYLFGTVDARTQKMQ